GTRFFSPSHHQCGSPVYRLPSKTTTLKQHILILGALVLAFFGACSVWLYAQQAVRQDTAAPPIHPPSLHPESSTLAQVMISSTSAPVTVAAATATATVGTPVASPSTITVGISSSVTVTVQVNGS